MRKHFQEYLALSEEEKQTIWKKGVFVLDANVLLNMCRYSKQSCDELLGILTTHKKRIWLPYQVALEFFNNRLSVIENIRNGFVNLLENVGKIGTILEDGLKFKDFRSDTAHNIEQLRKDFKGFQKRELNKIKKWQQEFETSDKEAILNQILDLYQDKVGDDYDADKLKELYKEGEERKKKSIPPGYADWNEKIKNGIRHACGDFIWWMQAIDYARDNKCNLIFVTDEKKEDWWYKISGKIFSPRVELIREFHDKTDGQKFLIYRTHQFMEIARKLDGAKVSDASIQEVKTTGSTDYDHSMGYWALLNDISKQLRVNPQTILGRGAKLTNQGIIPDLSYQGLQGTIDPKRNLFSIGIDTPSYSSPSGGMTMTEITDYLARHDNDDGPAISKLFSDESIREDLIDKIRRQNKKEEKDNEMDEEIVEI